VHKFERAFADGWSFCLIYSEADDPEMIFAAYNSSDFENILQEYKVCKTIFHAEDGNGEYCESYYYNGGQGSPLGAGHIIGFTLPAHDVGDEYLDIIYKDFIEDKIWHDCGIIYVFDERYNLAGYLAYYELAENIRDVSYIYVKKEFRNSGYAKTLLNYFKNKNIQENKISYYSYAADEASANLAKSCGFLACARRYEREN
jgi:predicted GNAT family acetyltransferase